MNNTGYEILVHNLSHSDLVLGLNTLNHDLTSYQNIVVARPKFSYFKKISESILETILLHRHKTITSLSNSILQSRKTSNDNIKNINKTSTENNNYSIPVGYDFDNQHDIFVSDIDMLRFRHDDKNVLTKATTHKNQEDTIAASIESVYFPLIALLIPKWIRTIDMNKVNYQKVIVLVSGRGKPVDENADIADNSTKYTARLIEYFIKQSYPEVKVRLVHSNTNLFRYDENIVFVKRELLPIINEYRDQLVAQPSIGSKWKECMRLSLSFADGSSARISAINASLRYYRYGLLLHLKFHDNVFITNDVNDFDSPSYMHFWQLKSFWREKKMYEDDIEFHTYEEIATEPAIALNNREKETFDPLVVAVLDEMALFRAEFNKVMTQQSYDDHDLATFWLRKTKKPVLSVLLVQKPNQPYKLYRGTNMEVSMPTGSLCAERNVIGTALSDDITLKRQDIKIISVYSATMALNPSGSNKDTTVRARSDSENTLQAGLPGSNSKISPSPPFLYNTRSRSNSISATSVCIPCSNTSTSDNQTNNNIVLSEKNNQPPVLSIQVQMDLEEDSSAALTTTTTSPVLTGHKRKIMNMPYNSSSNINTINQLIDELPLGPPITAEVEDVKMRGNSHPLLPPNPNNGLTDLSPPGLPSVVPHPKQSSSNTSRRLSKTRTVAFSSNLQPPSNDITSCDQRELFSSRSTVQTSAIPTSSTIIVDENDMNPLKPCGACNEWLKKIAEVNPQLQVITFTDADCNGVYLEHICDD